MGPVKAQDVHFDIDKYVNRYVFPSQLHRLPWWISRWLGYRRSKKPDVGNVLVAWWSFIGAVAGLCLVAAVFNYTAVQGYHPPILIASFGATAILEYNTIQSPLAQPRNSLLGHGLAAIIGVGVTKLFVLSPDFDEIAWVVGATSTGIASAVMGMTKTVHPPGGATALLAAVEPNIRNMGWTFVPVVLLGSVLMLLSGLVINNIQRQFPTFWWTPEEVGRRKASDEEQQSDTYIDKESIQSGRTWKPAKAHILTITAEDIHIPTVIDLSLGEKEAIESVREKLRQLKSGAQCERSVSVGTDRTQVQSRTDLRLSSELEHS